MACCRDLLGWCRLIPLMGVAALPFASGCRSAPAPPSVVIYASVDQPYAEPLLRSFETATGIRVKAVYDVEAAKTTGLVNRLIAEKPRPQADVYWSGEFAQTMLLQRQGVLAPYQSALARGIPAEHRDGQGYWTGLGLRARVLIVNTKLVPAGQRPRSLQDLNDAHWPAGTIGLANPLFGTTATHAAALYALWGRDRSHSFFRQLQARGVRLLDGNSVVARQVADGQLRVGLTDTDDALSVQAKGAPVQIILPDQEPGGIGTLLIPTTVCQIAGGPNPAGGRALIDYLLRPETEQALMASGWLQFPLRPGRNYGPLPFGPAVRAMRVAPAEIGAAVLTAREDLRDIFLR